jgi:hypothetical protein
MLGRRSRLGLLWARGAVPGGVAADDLVARKQRIAGRPGNARNAAVSTWDSFLWDHRRGLKLWTDLPPLTRRKRHQT